MADVSSKIRDAVAKVQALKEAVNEIKKPASMSQFGEQIRSMIKIRTRVGFGVDRTGDTKHPMKPLSDNYIERRQILQGMAGVRADRKGDSAKGLKGNAKRQKLYENYGLSPETTASKSNLTRTGQMLDSLAIKSVSTGRVSVGPTGSRTGSEHSNADIAEFNAEKGRSFNFLSDIELKRLNDSIKQKLKSIMRGMLTK